MPAAPGKGTKKWEDEHTKILVEGIIQLVQTHRRSLYALPGIVGEVDGHGNDATLRTTYRLLAAFARANGVDPAVVKDKQKRKVEAKDKDGAEESEGAGKRKMPRKSGKNVKTEV
ncbi:hypothetical protein CC85DRAFT_303720 [Cutaneotrichosporon oleaginosum]|uniref:Uncharacterized protein n=1 Tax=Cutaneotrichosporon oleaginosum TaxID=879819 RepID=A0A0J0XIM6_9TREE|nr:uncharacterized protein CC85DRAFT_303720 [Cutaneotrichosporon oleaginosum]KLT40940.1 hypothetical protein CC85DRAFT_303720 [Cutaneotrichosporon oleaginosum]TXT15432.1 hypothetical protein COLE_01625 [Cutaneotrichosporon oleaginosum]